MENATDQIQILYVDDEPGFADTAATFLKREDNRITVETATGPQQGHTYLADHDVDCLVSDYNMPGQNGIEFLEAVREDYPDLPFILYTGKGSEAVASDAISAGVTDYLQKESGTSQYTVLANRVTNAVDQHRSKRELQESRNRLSLFVEQSPLGVIEWNEDFEITRANNAACDILGYTESELIGHSWEFIVPESDRDDVGDVVGNLLNAEGGYLSVNENRTKNGETVACEWHNRVVTDDDAVVTIFSQFQDISERLEREQRIETLHETARTLMQADSPEHVGQIVVNNLKDTLDMPVNGVWFHDQAADVLRPAAFTDRVQELIGEPPTFEPGNSLAWEVFATGEVRHYDDVSAVGGCYNRETIMGSEISVPLGAHGVVTIGSTETDAFDAIDVSLAEIVASHANAVLDNLLTLTRKGNQVSEMEPVDLNSLTQRCWQNTQTGAATIRLETERVIEADRPRLRQLVENLFANAIEHAGEDVTVTFGELADGFYIEDDGPGISAEAHNNVFDTGFSTSEGGTGLGLAIVREILQAHGWQIQIETSEAGGARFEITGVDFVESSA